MNKATSKIENLRRGNADDWENLVSEISPRLFALFGSMLGLPNETTRELVSEVFIKAFKNIANFKNKSSIETWISAIATNLAKDYIKTQYRERKHLSLEDIDEVSVPARENLMEAQDKRHIVELLGELPESYRKVLTLYFLEEHKYEKIAEVMHIPMGTVKTLIFRGKKILREKYIKRYGDNKNER